MTSLNLDELFPRPSLPPSPLCPQRLPGANPNSLAALQHVLKDNNKRFHIFFNNDGFHNHITHRALAIYALGGSAQIIRDYYERDSQIQRPAFQSPEPITEDNFVDHLGDERYYQAYMSFFSEQVSAKGVVVTLEEFIFSEKYNFRKDRNANEQPEMLGRFISGILHPWIHVGYGLEFGLNGMSIEGLAMTAIHKLRARPFLSPSSFVSGVAIGTQNIVPRLSSLHLDAVDATGTPAVSKSDSVHAFDIVARILKDDRLKGPMEADQMLKNMAKNHLLIREYADQWTVDLTQPGEVVRKMEELVWLSSIVYGVGGLKKNGGHQSDFILMHLVTSSLFLPSLITSVSPHGQVLLLRAYLVSVLMWYILRGRPALRIKSFMETTAVQPSIPANPVADGPPTTETTPTPNPFLPVLQSSIAHAMDHVIKIQRTFAHFDTIYGTRPAGYFKGTELEGAELLDGSLFLRSALLTMDYVGWAREGQEARQFSFEGF